MVRARVWDRLLGRGWLRVRFRLRFSGRCGVRVMDVGWGLGRCRVWVKGLQMCGSSKKEWIMSRVRWKFMDRSWQ